MEKETIGLISGLIVCLSIIPYALRTYQKIITPNLTSWSLWTLIGLALLLTYDSSGARSNIWPAVFGFTNPFLITILLISRKNDWKKPDSMERKCLIFGFLSFSMWIFMKSDKNLVQYALYIGMVADACAAIPTIKGVWKNPQIEKPFAWGMFAIGYGLVIFAIDEHTMANYLLPIYMFIGSFIITLPLILHRIGKPIWEWI